MKLFGTKRNAAHAKKSSGSRGRLILFIFLLALLVAGGIYALFFFGLLPFRVQINPPRPLPSLWELFP